MVAHAGFLEQCLMILNRVLVITVVALTLSCNQESTASTDESQGPLRESLKKTIPFVFPKPLTALDFQESTSDFMEESLQQQIENQNTSPHITTFDNLTPGSRITLPLKENTMEDAIIQLAFINNFFIFFDFLEIEKHWKEGSLPIRYSLAIKGKKTDIILSRDPITEHPKMEVEFKSPDGANKGHSIYEIIEAPSLRKPFGAFILKHIEAHDNSNERSQLVVNSYTNTPHGIAFTLQNESLVNPLTDPDDSIQPTKSTTSNLNKLVTSLAVTSDTVGDHVEARIFQYAKQDPSESQTEEATLVQFSKDSDLVVYDVQSVNSSVKDESIESLYAKMIQKKQVDQKCFKKDVQTPHVIQYQLFDNDDGRLVRLKSSDEVLKLNYTHNSENDRNGSFQGKDTIALQLQYSYDSTEDMGWLDGIPNKKSEDGDYNEFEIKDGTLIEGTDHHKYKIKATFLENVVSVSESPNCPKKEISIPLENPLAF